jgi:hypothetical protein
MSYLKLTNLETNTEFIVKKCKIDDFKQESKDLYNKLKEKYDNQQNEGDTTRYSFESDVCCIYSLQPIVKQGYIWKSSSLKRIDLYKITLVEEYPQEEKVTEIFFQHGLGYSSNIITTQFPLIKYPMEMTKELESRLKLVRDSYLTDSDSESESESESKSSNISIDSCSGFAENDTDTSSEEILMKKKML